MGEHKICVGAGRSDSCHAGSEQRLDSILGSNHISNEEQLKAHVGTWKGQLVQKLTRHEKIAINRFDSKMHRTICCWPRRCVLLVERLAVSQGLWKKHPRFKGFYPNPWQMDGLRTASHDYWVNGEAGERRRDRTGNNTKPTVVRSAVSLQQKRESKTRSCPCHLSPLDIGIQRPSTFCCPGYFIHYHLHAGAQLKQKETQGSILDRARPSHN